MHEVADFLQKSSAQYFATVGTDGKPKVRPFQFMFEEGGKLYFCTSNQKPVFAEMQAQPYVEVCTMGEGSSWLRLAGKAVFSDNLALKGKVMEVSPLVKSIYGAPDNPAFELFYLAEATATITDFSGNPPRTFAL